MDHTDLVESEFGVSVIPPEELGFELIQHWYYPSSIPFRCVYQSRDLIHRILFNKYLACS